MPCDFCGALAISDFELTHMGHTARLLICGNCLGYNESDPTGKGVWQAIKLMHDKVNDRLQQEADNS